MNFALKSVLRAGLPRRVSPKRILAGPLRGAAIVTSWHDYPAAILGRTERKLLEWFASNVRPGETWLDVGAHYGYTAIALSRLVGSTGRVFAFEPMLSTAGHLARTRSLNDQPQLVVLPVGLACPETLELQHVTAERGMIGPTGAVDTTHTMLVARLDWLWPQISHGLPRVDGIKIDVQGMEIDVLRGARALLATHAPKLVVEVHPHVPRAQLLDLLRGVGYNDATPIEPVAGETMPQYVDDRSYFFAPGPVTR